MNFQNNDNVAMMQELEMLSLTATRLALISDMLSDCQSVTGNYASTAEKELVRYGLESIVLEDTKDDLDIDTEALVAGNEAGFMDTLRKIWNAIVKIGKKILYWALVIIRPGVVADFSTDLYVRVVNIIGQYLSQLEPAYKNIDSMGNNLTKVGILRPYPDLMASMIVFKDRYRIVKNAYDKIINLPIYKNFFVKRLPFSIGIRGEYAYFAYLIVRAANTLVPLSEAHLETWDYMGDLRGKFKPKEGTRQGEIFDGDIPEDAKDLNGDDKVAVKTILALPAPKELPVEIKQMNEDGWKNSGPFGYISGYADAVKQLESVSDFLADAERYVENKQYFLRAIPTLAGNDIRWDDPAKLQAALSAFLEAPNVKGILGKKVRVGGSEWKFDLIASTETSGGKLKNRYVGLVMEPTKEKNNEAVVKTSSKKDMESFYDTIADIEKRFSSLTKDFEAITKTADKKEYEDYFVQIREMLLKATRAFNNKPVHNELIAVSDIFKQSNLSRILHGDLKTFVELHKAISGLASSVKGLPVDVK